MGVKDWIKQAEGNGWRFHSAADLVLTLQCCKQGCDNRISMPMDNLGPTPEPCDRPHQFQYSGTTFNLYKDLIEQLIRRRRSLGLSQEDVCAAAALADGHISKLEAFHRIGQLPTLQLWADTLGLSLSLTPVPLPNATLRAIENRPAPLQDRAPKPRQKRLFDDK